ncbi:RrF2 family transcriptional regulator [Cellulosilyticum ruminicola]|uniref:RrF2 family transcriptional regulator n=1 Tax=Cellulosilyticum ruminicola TaxID=425254 RepID=UPI0006CF3127|nr:Rrf2 family transcriptional regulator [Cellulosilyticum ruminicola]
MVVTTRGKNALKIMLDLSLHQEEGFIKLKDIAKRQEVSEKYLEQIASILHKARKIKSSRGANGGYCLIKKPDCYTIGEIIKSLEGDIASTDCTYNAESSCTNRDNCFCYPLWIKLDKAINNVLENTTLQDLIDWKRGAAQ